MSRKRGIAAAVRLTTPQRDLEQAAVALEKKRVQQLSLLPTPAIEGLLTPPKRGKGRPRGAMNKATADMVAFIRARYTDPRIFLAETYSRPVEELARELGCSKLDAFEIQAAAAKDLLSYVASKMPAEVKLTDTREVHLHIHRAPVAPRRLPGDGAKTVVIEANDESEEKQ